MQFGICTSPDKSAAVKAAGFDYVEGSTQALLQGLNDNAAWDGADKVRSSSLPMLACNVMVPGSLRITGPGADLSKLRDYMTRILTRAGQLGIKTIVFGSGGARNVPDGFDRDRARLQIIDFARMFAPIAQQNGVTVVAEPLNRKECNIINSVGEAMEYVRAIDHPGFQCLVDSYHFWLEDEPLENLRAAMPWIKHVHVADEVGRTPPGESGQSDYRPFFNVLKEGGYDGMISIEAGGFDDIAGVGPRALRHMREQWETA